MAINQYKDDLKRPNMPVNKAYKTCLRTVKFGIALFNTGELKFEPVRHPVTQDEIDTAFLELNDAYALSKLPKEPDEKQFRDFLYELRVADI